MDDVFSKVNWIKSSKSGAAGHCVEAAFLPETGALRASLSRRRAVVPMTM